MKKIKEVKTLFELEKKYNELKNKIENLSTYNPLLIAKYLCLVMSSYENMEYEVIVEENVFLGKKIYIQPKDYNRNAFYFKLFSYDFEEKCFYDTYDEKRTLTVLFPSGFLEEPEEDNYLQDYIDFLFCERSKDNMIEISDDYLNTKTNDYLEKTKGKQIKYFNNKNKKFIEDEQETKTEDFKIERKSIFRAIKYILNNYSNIHAFEEIEEENVDTNKYDGIKINHSIRLFSESIPSANKVIEYKKLITYPKNKEHSKYDYVRYEDLLNGLGEDVINNCQVLDDFLYNVSELFADETEISREEIDELFNCYKVENVKKKILELNKEDDSE